MTPRHWQARCRERVRALQGAGDTPPIGRCSGHKPRASDRATAVARQQKNVTAVHNNLTVKPTAHAAEDFADDSVITTKVKSALAGDPRTKAGQINVETSDGQVQLSGFVDDSEAKSTAEVLARSVEHVKSVNNQIDVKK